MSQSKLQFGNERRVSRWVGSVVQFTIGILVVVAMRLGYGPDDDMNIVLQVIGYVFAFIGIHNVLHYRVVRVHPDSRKLQIGYRWYFFDSLRDASFDEFSSIRVIQGHYSSSNKTRTSVLMLTNTKFDCDERVVEDSNHDLVLQRGKELARATGFDLFLEDARSEHKEKVVVE